MEKHGRNYSAVLELLAQKHNPGFDRKQHAKIVQDLEDGEFRMAKMFRDTIAAGKAHLRERVRAGRAVMFQI